MTPPTQPREPVTLAADLFGAAFTKARVGDVRMGADYILGSGDQVALTAFGSVNLNRVLELDRGGKVALPELGILELRGLTLGAARQAVRRALERKHAGLEQFSLELVGLHDVEVYVLGEVPRPGSYLVPSVCSPVTLLGLAGGIGDPGSYRRIQHLRGGRVLHSLDLYRLRFEGSGLESLGFQDGDTLFVPLAQVRILAKGAFRRVVGLGPGPDPGLRVELLPGEGARQAVAFAGGLVASASRILLTVQRTSGDGLTTVHNIRNVEPDLGRAQLWEGDLLRALVRAERTEAFVEAAGCVAVPGRFGFSPGMRVKDLLTLGGEGQQVLPGSYRLHGEILRTDEDGGTQLLGFNVDAALAGDPAGNLELQPRDRVELGKLADLRLPQWVTLLGPFTRPGVYPWHAGMRCSDLVYRAGVPKLSAEGHYAELARIGDNQTRSVRRLALDRLLSTEGHAALALADEVGDPLLQPYDQITVYENPGFRLHRTVTVSGQVQRPGPYVILEDRFTLSQLIQRAGGLTRDAMPAGGIFLRSVLPAPASPDRADPAGSATVAGAGDPAFNSILERLSETRRSKESGALLSHPLLHGLLVGALNRLVVDFAAALKADPRQDVALQDGDQVFIPRLADSAYVVGEVASPFASFHVKPGDRVRDLLKLAGGYTRNADQAQIRLLKADGRILDSRVEGAAIEAGDALLVPQRFRKDVTWQDNLQALTPLALLANALRR